MPALSLQSKSGSHGSTREPAAGVQGGISSARYSGAGVGVWGGVEDGGEASQAASSNNVISIAKNGAARKNIVAFPTATHSLP